MESNELPKAFHDAVKQLHPHQQAALLSKYAFEAHPLIVNLAKEMSEARLKAELSRALNSLRKNPEIRRILFEKKLDG